MGGERSPTASWCIIRNDSKLKTAIKSRIQSRGYKLVEVASATSIKVDRISKYLRGYQKHLTQYQVVKLAKFLGIEIQLDVKFKE